jgi:hypothetical protein
VLCCSVEWLFLFRARQWSHVTVATSVFGSMDVLNRVVALTRKQVLCGTRPSRIFPFVRERWATPPPRSSPTRPASSSEIEKKKKSSTLFSLLFTCTSKRTRSLQRERENT